MWQGKQVVSVSKTAKIEIYPGRQVRQDTVGFASSAARDRALHLIHDWAIKLTHEQHDQTSKSDATTRAELAIRAQ